MDNHRSRPVCNHAAFTRGVLTRCTKDTYTQIIGEGLSALTVLSLHTDHLAQRVNHVEPSRAALPSVMQHECGCSGTLKCGAGSNVSAAVSKNL